MSDWFKTLDRVFDDMRIREENERKELEQAVPNLIVQAKAMPNDALIEYYTDICRRGFSDPRKTVIWDVLVAETRLEIKRRLNNAN